MLVFVVVASVASAQKSIDSLESKLRGNLNDSLRIETLLTLSKEYQYLDLKKSLETCEKALQISETKNLTWGKSKSYLWLASIYSLSGDFTTSAKYNNLALGSSFELKDTLIMSRGYNNLGLNYYAFGKYDEAYFYYTQSYRLANLRKDSLGMAVSLHNIATVFKELGQYANALNYLRLTQEISNDVHDYEDETYNYDEIGDIYRRKKEYDSALNALTRSLKVSRSLRLKINDLIPVTLIKIANTYLDKRDNAHALAYYDTAKIFFQKTDNEYGLAEVDLGRAIVYLSEKKFEQARSLMESSKTTAHDANWWALEIECLENLAALYE